MHKRAIYPAGHPMLQGAVERLWASLSRLAADRRALSIGIAKEQVIIEGVAVDEADPLFREFALRMHEHQLAALRVQHGVVAQEVAALLELLATPGSRSAVPLGVLPPAELNRWEHIALYPAKYDKLRLTTDEVDPDAQARATVLWLGLARAALSADWTDGPESEVPEHLAEAIDRQAEEEVYRQVVVGYLKQIANECAFTHGASTGEIVLKQVSDVLTGKLAKRAVDVRSLKYADPEKISGNKLKHAVTVRTGVEQDLAKRIQKLVKESKLKVQSAIQGDQVRVTGKKRDDLQQAIALLREAGVDQPLQFTNFRD